MFKKRINTKTQCLPGCVLSFGYEENISLVIEQDYLTIIK